MKHFKRSILAAAVCGVTAAGFGGAAQATALATSVLDITNFVIKDATSGNILDKNNDFTAIAGTNNADTSASLGSVAGTATFNSGNVPIPGGIDSPIVCQGSGCPGIAPDNTFPVRSSALGDPAGHYAAADQVQSGSPITGFGVPVGARAGHGAYVALIGQDGGSSTANNGLNTSFKFKLGHAGKLILSFNARAYLEAFTSATEAFPTNAQASYSLNFQISDSNGVVVSWSPDGTNALGTGITAETDPFNLNDNVSRTAPFNGASWRGAALGSAFNGSWSATTVPLAANTVYQFSIKSTSTADAARVPEPGILALMGIGMLGFGFSRGRNLAV